MIKKILKVSGVILSLIMIGIALLVGYPYPYYKHNHNLKIFTKNFDAIKLPETSTQIGKTFKLYGGILPTGNSGGYLVAKLIKSNKAESYLEKYFQKILIPTCRVLQNS